MHPDDRRKLYAVIFGVLPLAAWLFAVRQTTVLGRPKLALFLRLLWETPHRPILLGPLVGGVLLAALVAYAIHKLSAPDYAGAPFRTFLRGTAVTSSCALARRTTERHAEQVTVARIPMPTSIESLHLLVSGSTGSGKSVLVRELAYGALLRRDRIVAADPNGDMVSKFYRPDNGDVILNPYDQRSAGWSFFNEVRNDYDFKRLSLSIVPRGQTEEEESWREYARLLLTETARKLSFLRTPDVRTLFRWLTVVHPDELKAFLKDTPAESLFVGADRALASARFVLSSKLPEHLSMPAGNFSIRTWLEQPKGNLFITWREDMAEALRPLISAWVDVLCTSILSRMGCFPGRTAMT